MLTPYDEFPVHQSSRPFSYIPSTDYNWDDGYYFGVFNPDEKVFLATGARINPNSDIIGGYALLNVAGQQFTLRFNRCWRDNFDVSVGPWQVKFLEPLKVIQITLAENNSGLSFDLIWEGTSPAFLEEHHIAEHRGRRSTDQSRYSQPGKVSGWIKFRDQLWQLDPEKWSGARDHSWGLYAERPPLSPVAELLPPRKSDTGPQRVFRFWTCFRTEKYSGFYHMHETAEGVQCKMNDVFGTPFGGKLYEGWDTREIALVSGRHELVFDEGTRILKTAIIYLIDDRGDEWKQVFERAAPPWIVQTMGYHPGSWKDGGTFFTYHGSEELALEWDEFDFSHQPAPYTPYQVTGSAVVTSFGTGTGTEEKNMVQGPEYLMKLTTYAPDGTVSVGAAQVENFINGRYDPYDLT